MSALVELYVREITKEGATITIEDVPVRLREQVRVALEAIQQEP